MTYEGTPDGKLLGCFRRDLLPARCAAGELTARHIHICESGLIAAVLDRPKGFGAYARTIQA